MGKFGKAKAAKTRVVHVGKAALASAKSAAASARARVASVSAKVKSKATGVKYAMASLAGAAVTGAARGMTDGEVMGFDTAHVVAAGLGVAGAVMPGEWGNFAITAAAGAEGPALADMVEGLVGGGDGEGE